MKRRRTYCRNFRQKPEVQFVYPCACWDTSLDSLSYFPLINKFKKPIFGPAARLALASSQPACSMLQAAVCSRPQAAAGHRLQQAAAAGWLQQASWLQQAGCSSTPQQAGQRQGKERQNGHR